jgi:probable HAF family extracellular repeat protein
MENVQDMTVLAYFFRKLAVFAVSVLILIHPGGRLGYGAGLTNVFTCYSGPTNTPITSRDINTIYTVGNAINNAGSIVGEIQLTTGHQQGYVFFGGACYLIDYPNASATIPAGINDNGTIVGYYDDSAKRRHGFWYNGQWNSYDVPGSTATVINAINNHDVFVGQFSTANETSGYFVANGQAFHVVYPSARTTNLTGITDNDVLLGIYTDAQDLTHSFIKAPDGPFINFDVPGAQHTIASGIANPPSNTIVGYWQAKSNGAWHSFNLINGNLTTYDLPQQNSSNTLASGVNDKGDVVGQVTQPVVVGQGTQQKVNAWVYSNAGPAGWSSPDTGVIPAALLGKWLWQSNHDDGGRNQCTGAPTGQIWAATLVFASNGAVQLVLDIIQNYTPDGCRSCAQNSVWNLSGTYAAYGPHLRLNVQGQQTYQDTCNSATNFQTPIGLLSYDWLFIASVEPSGSLLDLHTQSQAGPQFDLMLLANPG